jgi:hypothetical protein
MFFSCVHTYPVKITPLTNQDFSSISRDIPIQIFENDTLVPESYRKLAQLEINDDREYYQDIRKVFYMNGIEQLKNIARNLGAHGIAFISLGVKTIDHPPGEYEMYDRFGKKSRIRYAHSFSTYRFQLQGVAIRLN